MTVQSLNKADLEPDASDRRLVECLLAKGKLREQDLTRASRLVGDGGGSLSAVLVRLGAVSDRDLAEVLAEALSLVLLGSADYPEDSPVEAGVSVRFLKESRAVPLGLDGERLLLAMADPRDEYVIDAVALASGRDVEPRVGLPGDIETAIERYHGAGRSAMGQLVEGIGEGEAALDDDVEHLKDMASEAPVIRVVNLILHRAVDARASDIHIEPFEGRLKVRYRIDGVLSEVEAPPARSTAAVISRVKIMARLNIAERRLPQDGRIKLRVQGKELDLRVSTVPTLYGESVVMRLLDKERIVLDFDALGFQGDVLKRFLEVLQLPYGILLVTGPTGSGKSTTLYTALNQLNTPERKIITAEDPVEYQLEGINQIQVKPQIGLSFANALRSIVRQDPDVIMIGEMRDLETAKIAVQSALTGHLVLSTLHTNDAASSINRLLDMGLEDYLLTSTVNGVLAQRLVRRLCGQCRKPYPALPEMVEEMNLRRFSEAEPITLYHAGGCDQCGHTGYRGRLAILEFLPVSDAVRGQVMRQATAGEILRTALADGMRTMYEDGLYKAVAGLTTIEEVLQAVMQVSQDV